MKTAFLLICVFTTLLGKEFQSWESKIVHYEDGQCGWIDGRLTYHSDESCNRIPDFSYAGYRLGDVPLPNIPIVKTLYPLDGDNAHSIQEAIDSIDSPGALLLMPGAYYEVSETIFINKDGIVLRGVLDPAHPQDPKKTTILLCRAENKQAVIIAGSGESQNLWDQKDPLADIVTPFVPIGSNTFEINHSEGFEKEDQIMIKIFSDQPLYFPRFIKNIAPSKQGAFVTIDAPIFQHINGQSLLYKWKRNAKCEIGIESLKIEIENETADAILLQGIENSWIKDLIVEGFSQSAITITNASRLTLSNILAVTDKGDLEIEGFRNHFHCGEKSDLVLFQRVHAEDARHAFLVSGNGSTSGIVFLDSTALNCSAASGSLNAMSMGLLFDHVEFSYPNAFHDSIALDFCRTIHSVAWGVKVPTSELNMNAKKISQRLAIQKIDHFQNYAVGTYGKITGREPEDQPGCYIESKPIGQYFLEPTSLYEAQKLERKRYGIAPSTPVLQPVIQQKNFENLHWLPSMGVSSSHLHYIIECAEDEEKTFHPIATLPGVMTEFVDVPKTKSLYYRVRAMETLKGNRSAYSNYLRRGDDLDKLMD